VAVLQEAVRLSPAPADHETAALRSARVLGLWGHHDSVSAICHGALAAGDALDPATADSLEAELFANSTISAATADEARARAKSRLADPAAPVTWRVNDALLATNTAQPASEVLARLAPVLDSGFRGIAPDSLTAVYALLALIWNDELGTASQVCDTVLSAAREQGSMSMVAHVSCLRSMIMRRFGQLEDAVTDGMLALEFKLTTSPPLAVAWAAGIEIEALTRLGRLDEAEAIAAVVAKRDPPAGWIHTLAFLQARGALRVAQQRPAEALDDLVTAGAGWCALDVSSPAIAPWRTAAAAAHLALGHPEEAAALTSDQLALARKAGAPITLGAALRAHAEAAGGPAEESLGEAISLLEPGGARYELALALTDLGSGLRRAGRRTEARTPLRRALDLAERTGAAPLAARAREELLAAGARPRRTALTGPDALTSTERRVARLAADGLSNRQIAQHLFITQATVETHLRHAFGKLGIASRADLPAQLGG
jgi:ATP/maltotriose-dependent transcriptional regulator MalT